MHKKFQSAIRLGADGGNLLQCQFACQNDLRQTDVLQEAGFFRGADVGLGACVQLNWGQVKLQQPHVLDDQGIDSCVIQLPGQLAGTF